MPLWKRASTPGEKHELIKTIESQWNIPPDLRLGQLIYDAVTYWNVKNKRPAAERDISRSIFYIEDSNLLAAVTLFVRDHYPPG